MASEFAFCHNFVVVVSIHQQCHISH